MRFSTAASTLLLSTSSLLTSTSAAPVDSEISTRDNWNLFSGGYNGYPTCKGVVSFENFDHDNNNHHFYDTIVIEIFEKNTNGRSQDFNTQIGSKTWNNGNHDVDEEIVLDFNFNGRHEEIDITLEIEDFSVHGQFGNENFQGNSYDWNNGRLNSKGGESSGYGISESANNNWGDDHTRIFTVFFNC